MIDRPKLTDEIILKILADSMSEDICSSECRYSDESLECVNGCNEIQLEEYKRQIRADAIDEFLNQCDVFMKWIENKHPWNGYVIARADLFKIAEQIKEQTDEHTN